MDLYGCTYKRNVADLLLSPLRVAVMVARPTPTVVTTPIASTVATVVLLLVHANELFVSTVAPDKEKQLGKLVSEYTLRAGRVVATERTSVPGHMAYLSVLGGRMRICTLWVKPA